MSKVHGRVLASVLALAAVAVANDGPGGRRLVDRDHRGVARAERRST